MKILNFSAICESLFVKHNKLYPRNVMRKFLFFVVRNFANRKFTYIISQQLFEPLHTLGTWLKTSFGAVFCLRGVRLLFVFRSYKHICYYFFIFSFVIGVTPHEECIILWRKPVFRIRIRRIRMFLGLLNPDILVRGMDPDPDPSIIKKNSKKNLDSYCLVTSFWLFIFEKWCKCTCKK